MNLPPTIRRAVALLAAIFSLAIIAMSLGGPGVGDALRGAARGLSAESDAPDETDSSPASSRLALVDADGLGGVGASVSRVAMAGGDHSVTETSTEVTQHFDLQPGWNTIYLEVEPTNGSPLVDSGPVEGREPGSPPILEPSMATIDWVFNPISDVLESVWTWRSRGTTMDFIVHPGEGLWDAPGWDKYFPEGSAGPDGESREFLTDLFALHANRGYLVHIADSAPATVTLDVVGRPEVGRPPRGPGEYNVFGFPIHPNFEPDLATFVCPLPIDEVLELQADGTWNKLWDRADGCAPGAAFLRYGEAYLVKVPDEGEQTSQLTRNGLLDIDALIGEGLEYGPGESRRGSSGVSAQTVRVKNRHNAPAEVSMRLISGNPPVHLVYEDGAIVADLSTVASVTRTIGTGTAGEPLLSFQVPAAMQDADGEAILEIASADLGTRWLIPITARTGDLAGLWVGDVTVSEVSEGRLGSTNVQPDEDGALPMLTFGLRPRNDSQVRGSVTLAERSLTTGPTAGQTVTLDVEIQLELPDVPAQAIPEPVVLTGPVVAGYVFEDRSGNGQKDLPERGFSDIVVELTGNSTVLTATTRSNGSWIITDTAKLTAGTWDINFDPPNPSAFSTYTRTFPVTEPVTATESITAMLATAPSVRANRWPTQLVIAPVSGSLAVSSVSFLDADNTASTVPWQAFTTDSVTRNPVTPSLDFGYAKVYEASLYQGSCSSRDPSPNPSPIAAFAMVPVVNGVLSLTGVDGMNGVALNEGYLLADHEVLSDDYVVWLAQAGGGNDDDKGIACGELTVGKPTIVDGRGSQFEFRILLRVGEFGGDLQAAIVPHYVVDPGGEEEGLRLTAPAFAVTQAISRTGLAVFGGTGAEMDFDIKIDHRHALNPFKHKYHPDHDNLDAKFNPIDLNAPLPQPHQREVLQYRRKITLELVDSIADLLPYFPAGATPEELAQLDRELDWKGKTWGGVYTEVLKGIHKHDITVKGHFIIRHILQGGDLEGQSYD